MFDSQEDHNGLGGMRQGELEALPDPYQRLPPCLFPGKS